MANPVSAEFQYRYQVCPIFLTNGIAGGIQGGYLPIISLLNPSAFPSGLSGGSGPDFDLDDAIANFHPNPGGTLENYELGRYPFANQVTAANAIITEPLNISLTMLVTFKAGAASVPNRLAVMTSLKQTLDAHALAGGTYVVETVSYPYQNAILRALRDASSAEVELPQWRWVWDFEIPLVSLQDAANVAQSYNNLMSRTASGGVVQPDQSGSINWSGTAPVVGNPGSGAAPTVIPAAGNSTLLGSNPALSVDTTSVNPFGSATSGL